MTYRWLHLCILLLFCLSIRVTAQEQIKELPSGYLMTVAAYLNTGEGYAQRYTKKLVADGYAADYGFTYKKNMYFVYIKRYDGFRNALSEIISTRNNTPFIDAWVYAYEAEHRGNDVRETSAAVEEPKQLVTEPEPPAEVDSVAQDAEQEIEEAAAAMNPAVEEKIDDGSRLIYFESLDARTQDPVEVEVTFFDPFSERVIATMKSEETKRILPPTNADNLIRVKTNSFGWRGDAVSFDFKEPINDSTSYFLKFRGDTLVVFFDMHRLKKGDIQTLLNVYFIPDASLMRPVSKYELSELVEMLEEDPNYRIMLHGYTNGSSRGDYYRLAEGDTAFFSMNKKQEKTSGSAKKLSYDRANVVKQYLVYKGIAEDRIEVKGWGGKRMIYDENSIASKRNIRVEVEVLEE